jgi:hypothetical protein
MPGSVSSGSSSGGGGRGGGYSPNATVINTGGGGKNDSFNSQGKPTLIGAISNIQQYYVIEMVGQEIPSEFLTLEGTISFFTIGMRSGLTEGVLIAILLPLVEFYLVPVVLKSPTMFLKIILSALPFFPIIINTILCVLVGRYYVGNITRKAINSLFTGRIIVLMAKSFFVYVFYTLLTGLSTPERVWSVAQILKKNSVAFYAGYMKMLPHIMPIANRCAILILVGAVLPYSTVFIFDQWRRNKIERNRARVSGV